jgi:hypothetical protein
MTIAKEISALFFHDGRCFKTASGRSFDDVIRGTGAGFVMQGAATRWNFSDGSTITVFEDEWGLGYPDCFCWAESGHGDGCRHENKHPRSDSKHK